MKTRTPFVLVMAAGLMAGRANAQDNRHAYDITPEAGPYTICVMSYIGENSFKLAFDFVSELRAKYKLPAYLYSHTAEDRKQEEERREAMRKQRQEFYRQMGVEPPERAHFQAINIRDQYVVLIAAPSFKDIDSTKKVLNEIRKLKPAFDPKFLNAKWVGRDPAGNGKPEVQGAANDNPFLTAFVAPNPTVTKPKVAATEDKQEEVSLRDWNQDESLSAVHKIPGKWTLVVKAYRGSIKIVSQNSDDRSIADRLGVGKSQGSMMDANRASAHQLAEILRNPQIGFDAYVLHMPSMSVVTVGAFDSKEDPRMSQKAAEISKLHLNLQGATSASEPLEAPVPVQIPRK